MVPTQQPQFRLAMKSSCYIHYPPKYPVPACLTNATGMYGLHPGWGSKELYGSQLSPLDSTNSYRLWSPAEKLSDVEYPRNAEYSSDTLGVRVLLPGQYGAHIAGGK